MKLDKIEKVLFLDYVNIPKLIKDLGIKEMVLTFAKNIEKYEKEGFLLYRQGEAMIAIMDGDCNTLFIMIKKPESFNINESPVIDKELEVL